jgi:hypothetical protein
MITHKKGDVKMVRMCLKLLNAIGFSQQKGCECRNCVECGSHPFLFTGAKIHSMDCLIRFNCVVQLQV